MKVRIDSDLCQGHQMCAIQAPEVFGADELGDGIVLMEGELPAEDEAAARRAAGSCPERAVIVED